VSGSRAPLQLFLLTLFCGVHRISTSLHADKSRAIRTYAHTNYNIVGCSCRKKNTAGAHGNEEVGPTNSDIKRGGRECSEHQFVPNSVHFVFLPPLCDLRFLRLFFPPFLQGINPRILVAK
jgi:hypothetical protein